MAAPLAIQGSLVDAKNINTHKCVRLSIDVSAEMGAEIVKVFGWPTMVDPVPVAVARLNPKKTIDAVAEPKAPKDKRVFKDLPAATQAVLTGQEPRFWAFLREEQAAGDIQDEEAAAAYVRTFCQVGSRSELMPGSKAVHRWHLLASAYQGWEAAERIGA